MTRRGRLSFVAGLPLYYTVIWLRGPDAWSAIDQDRAVGASMKIEAIRNGRCNGETVRPDGAIRMQPR